MAVDQWSCIHFFRVPCFSLNLIVYLNVFMNFGELKSWSNAACWQRIRSKRILCKLRVPETVFSIPKDNPRIAPLTSRQQQHTQKRRTGSIKSNKQVFIVYRRVLLCPLALAPLIYAHAATAAETTKPTTCIKQHKKQVIQENKSLSVSVCACMLAVNSSQSGKVKLSRIESSRKEKRIISGKRSWSKRVSQLRSDA